MCGWIQHGPCSGSCMTCCACMILFAVCTLKKMGVTKCRWKGFGGGIQHAAHTAQQAHLLQPHPVMKGLEACFACSFVTAKPKRIPEPFSTRACKEQLVRFPCGVNMGMQAMNGRAQREREFCISCGVTLDRKLELLLATPQCLGKHCTCNPSPTAGKWLHHALDLKVKEETLTNGLR